MFLLLFFCFVLFVCMFFLDVFSFFRLTIIVYDVFITVSLCDVRLSHLNKDYLLTYKLSVLMYRCLNGAAPRYLTELATPVGSTVRRLLRSASSTDLVVPATRRSTIGDRAFAVAGPRAWNSLPPAVRSSATYNIFKKDLKSHLFRLSFSLLQLCILTMYTALVVVYTAYCALQIVRLTLHYITPCTVTR